MKAENATFLQLVICSPPAALAYFSLYNAFERRDAAPSGASPAEYRQSPMRANPSESEDGTLVPAPCDQWQNRGPGGGVLRSGATILPPLPSSRKLLLVTNSLASTPQYEWANLGQARWVCLFFGAPHAIHDPCRPGMAAQFRLPTPSQPVPQDCAAHDIPQGSTAAECGSLSRRLAFCLLVGRPAGRQVKAVAWNLAVCPWAANEGKFPNVR